MADGRRAAQRRPAAAGPGRQRRGHDGDPGPRRRFGGVPGAPAVAGGGAQADRGAGVLEYAHACARCLRHSGDPVDSRYRPLHVACGKPVDLTKGLQIDVVKTGWFDAGLVDGQNKLVPTITFTLKNVSDQTLATLQVNALFRRVGEKDEWGSGFMTAAGSSGLKPGTSTDPLDIKSQLGITGSEPRQEMLANAHFVDAKVDLYVNTDRRSGSRSASIPSRGS